MRVSYFIGAGFTSLIVTVAHAAETTTVGPEAKGIVDVVLQHGITGAMLLIVLYGYYKKDIQAREESAARIADSKAFGEAMRVSGERVVTVMERFNDTASTLLQEMRERHVSQHDVQQRPTRPGGPR